MSDIETKRAMLAKSHAALRMAGVAIEPAARLLAPIDSLNVRLRNATDPAEIAKLRAELAALEADFLKAMEALTLRLDERPKVWHFALERDADGALLTITATAIEGQ